MRLNEAQPEIVEHHLEQLPFLGTQVAPCLLLQQSEDVDDLGRRRKVLGGRGRGTGLGAVAEVHGRRCRQREDERVKGDHDEPNVNIPAWVTRMTQPAMEQFGRLVDVLRVLRSPNGCPWDREQTLESLSHFVLEETYEVLEAIDRGDRAGLREEIGDLLFEAVFLAQICAEAGEFDVGDSLKTVVDKLVRRHPHVFGHPHRTPASSDEPDWQPSSASDVVERWEVLKARERDNEKELHTTLSGIPSVLPALLRAYKIGHRVSAVGFDWDRPADVMQKIEEEVAELRESLSDGGPDTARAEEEMGDLLFAIANLSRKLGIEPEAALRRANDKFTRRFDRLEGRVVGRGQHLQDLTLDEMEKEWQAVKGEE